MTRLLLVSAALLLALACSSEPKTDGGVGGGEGGGTGGGGGGGGTGGGGTGGGGGGISEECAKAPNVARRQQLLASQPTVEVKKKQALTVTVSFPSEADDPSVSCNVDLVFKDSNASGALDPYEDWRKAPAERATDLLGRMSAAQKLALLAHASLSDVPTTASPAPSAATQAVVTAGIRFGLTSANTAAVTPRATWANAVQELAEESALGIPFALSSLPAHGTGNGRVRARGFSQWPNELGLAASPPAVTEGFARVVSQEYRAIGVRLALSPSGDLATEPRWYQSQFTFGEDSASAGDFVAAYVKGLQGDALGRDSVAAVVSGFPGSGAAGGGWDARLSKGKFVLYSGTTIDAHLAPFQKAIGVKAAGMMPSYGVPKSGSWTGLGGVLDGDTLEQVGAAFNRTLLTDALRTQLHFAGFVLAPPGVLEAPGVNPLGAPWGVETQTRAQRVAKAVSAGVDQFAGLNELTPLQEAKTAGLVTDAQVDASAGRVLSLLFQLGLFEDPYVDAAKAASLVNTDASYRAGLDAMNRGMVLLVNVTKPEGFLNGNGDGTQVGDKGNAGNGTKKVLPAPPGEPYVAAGCSYYIMGDFDLDYVRSVSAGYGELTNDATSIKNVPVTTAAQRIALSDYVFIRIAAPFTKDPDSGPLNLPLPSLEYATNVNNDALAALTTVRDAIAAWPGPPASRTQVVVGVDLGRPSVLKEILAFNPSALYVQWAGTLPGNPHADKVFLDVAFGIVNGTGTLPVGLPLSDSAAGTQKEDLPGDGQHPTFVKGFGLQTARFE